MKILVTANIRENNKIKLETTFPMIKFIYCNPKDLNQEIADDCDVIVGTPKNLNLNRSSLKALLLNSAGSDEYIKEGILHPHTLLANASGSYGVAIAEHVIGMILTLNKGFKTYINNMEEGVWGKNNNNKELYHSTVLIVGLGDLGYEIAKRLKAFDCYIIGIKRSASILPKSIDELYTIEQLDLLLPKADFVISCLPHSQETIHLFNKERLLKMKDDAVLVNVGRGSAIHTQDLIAVLQSDHLYGVALDVLEQEPLNKDNELWKMDNVFITPHVSGGFKWRSVRDYFTDLTIRNIYHILNDESLENEVDFKTGYRKDVKYR